MIKSRSTLAIPPSRPRRIWLNAVGSQNGVAREEELRRSLPFCDPETGTKNRVVQRDPISGLGMLGREFDPLQECRVRSRSAREKGDRNPILGQGDLGTESNGFRRQLSVRGRQEYRNPIDLTGESKEPELDALRPNNRPAKTIVQRANRDPISGRGDFGREWDPIRKYAGRPKPLQQQPPPKDARRARNPLTGDGHDQAQNSSIGTSTRRAIKNTNPLTGENCNSFSVKPEEKRQRARTASNSSRGSNPLTGEGCQSSDSRPSTPRKAAPQTGGGAGSAGGGNPLTGENCPSYDLSADFRSRPSSARGDTKNPLTGENCDSFDLSSDGRQRSSAPMSHDRPNPLTGENVSSFDINQELRSGKNMAGTSVTEAESAIAAATGDELGIDSSVQQIDNGGPTDEATGNAGDE